MTKEVILVAAIALASPVKADLYRWVDRESGSVKYSNTPPPWYGNPERERGAPAVEVLRYPAAGKPAAEPVSPAGRQSVEREARRTDLLKSFDAPPPSTDLAGPDVRERGRRAP